MGNTNYQTSILVDKTPTEVYEAILDVRHWWQGTIEGSTDKLNEEFTYEMQPYHFSKQKIVTLIHGKKVVWLVTASQINFVTDKEEWLNTKIIFDIAKAGDQTRLTFTHKGLVPTIECYGDCSGAWHKLISESLFSLITTGAGVEVFNA